MSKPAAAEDPPIEVSTVVRILIARETHPAWWATHALTWEHFMRRLQWRHAKPLFETYPDLVSEVVEAMVAGRPGTHSDTDAWMCLGMVRRRRGDYERAIVAFTHLWERDNDVRAGYNVGLCRRELGQIGAARKAFLAVLELKPGDQKTREALDALDAL